MPPQVPLPEVVHHGAVDGVTGSCHELVIDARASVLIDCGLFQGAETSREGAGAERLAIEFDVRRVKALLVTHCHIDHVGRIPYLFAAGFKGPVLCTRPTAELLPLVLEDAVRMGFTRDRRLVERFLRELASRLVPVGYGKWTAVPQLRTGEVERLEVRFQPAGHILGSAYIECRVRQTGATGPAAQASAGPAHPTTVVFSGDLGGPHTPLLPTPRPPAGADLLVLESTYGDRLHEARKERRDRLRALVEKCLANGGAILIPAFSIGRTQELLYELEDIIHRDRGRLATRGLPWEQLDIVVDSPLAARFTRAYSRLRLWWDAEAKQTLREGRHPLSFEQMVTVDSHDDHVKVVRHLQETARPAIVIAGSGMCAGGRIVDYLKALLGDPRTDVVFVGYQAEGTPGRAIQEHGPSGGWVELDGERHAIRAAVHTLPGYSAHADQAALTTFVRRMKRKPREVRLVHGSDPAKWALKQALEPVCPGARVWIP